VIADARTGADLDSGVDDHVTANQDVGSNLDPGAEQQARRQIGGLERRSAHRLDAAGSLGPPKIGGMLAIAGRRKPDAVAAVVCAWTPR
jgi:hypothetical protein